MAQLAAMALVSAGMLGGLVAGNLIWRQSHQRLTKLEREIQTVDLLNIRLMQAIPSMAHYQASASEGHLQGHLDQDIAGLQAFLLQLRNNELSSSGYPLAGDLSEQLRRILQQGHDLVSHLERNRDQLARNPHDPANQQEVGNQLLHSPELQSLRDSEDRLIQIRDARFADVGEAREQEERAEVLEVTIPLLATLLASAVGVALAWHTSRTMLRPLNRLNSRIQELRASGNLEAKPLDQDNLPEEIQALTENFNGLVQRLRDVLAQLEALSLTDPLTQVGNRRRFDHALAAEIARHRRQGKELALLLLDLDHFKPYNDLYGHPQGDRCLVQLAQALSCLFRRPGELICRIGGEEFAVLLPETGPQDALRQGRRILTAVEQLAISHAANPPLSRVSVSVGVSCGRPGDGFSGALLVDAADQALYRCKRDLGRNTVALADSLEPVGPVLPRDAATHPAVS